MYLDLYHRLCRHLFKGQWSIRDAADSTRVHVSMQLQMSHLSMHVMLMHVMMSVMMHALMHAYVRMHTLDMFADVHAQPFRLSKLASFIVYSFR